MAVERGQAARVGETGVLLLFGATLFLSALLLFAVQPLFTKMVLPRLGGSPAVWSVAMVFFQAMLLAGYACAHVLVRYARPARALPIHAAVMAVALMWLPIGIAAGYEAPPASGQPLWLLSLFASSLGMPFFAVAANAPLLQAWFARTGHAHADDPYFLYGASNIGSFVALIAYPTVLEPLVPLSGQAALWTASYGALFAGVLGCGALAAARARAGDAGPGAAEDANSSQRDWRATLGWVGWAFLPSALLVAVTAHLSTNIAAAPFLWVVPLAIFLLTFVLTFRRGRRARPRALQVLLAPAAAAALATIYQPSLFGVLGGIAVNLFAFFVIAMVWHGELVARRPPAARLTEFYLSMSVGGVLGGAFTSLAAPVIFDSVAEFPLLLVASVLALPEARRALARPVGLAALGVVALLFGYSTLSSNDYRDRSFFGVTIVRDTADGQFRLLFHGVTIHGAEKLAELHAAHPEPITYYTPEGPLALATRVQRARTPHAMAVGAVGLGAGSMACNSAPGEDWRFYEIDAAVVRVATNPQQFTFLSACAPDATIVLGDARLTLASEPDGAFDLLIVDAFSSDAIPLHLLTREAFALYMRKLRPGGVIVMNITNRFVELPSVVAATTAAAGLDAAFLKQERSDEELDALRARSDVAVVARSAADLAPFRAAGFAPLPADAASPAPWTDDYSNVVSAILRKQGLL